MELTSADFEERLNCLAKRVAVIKGLLEKLQSSQKHEFDDLHGRIDDLDKVCVQRCGQLADNVDGHVVWAFWILSTQRKQNCMSSLRELVLPLKL